MTNEGFKVFFSRITLEDKLGTAYEPYIFAALNSAKVMVVLGTKPEYFNAVWVKNEWSRYLALIKAGQKKILIPAYKDMDPYDLPEEFSHLQAQDMTKLGFMQDLIRGIKKILYVDDPKPAVAKETVTTETATVNTAPLLKRAFMFLEDGNWRDADAYCEKVLDQDPENAEAYLGKLMAELHVRKRAELQTYNRTFTYSLNYQKIVRFGNKEMIAELDEANKRINDDKYLHLRENGTGVGFATYNKVTGEPLESGQISEKNLPPDGQNTIPAARNWYLFELSDDDRKAIQPESVKILENIPQAGIGRRRIWDDPTIPRDDVRLINSHYDDLYRVPNHGVIQVDSSDGSSYTARVEHLDDYHFDLGEYGNVYHICQFGEMMERNGSTAYPEIQTQDEQGAWELGGKGYLAVQSCDDGWDYTLYHSDFSVMDGGQLGAPELTIQEAREQILEAHHMEKGRRLLQDYDAVMDKVAEAEELSADHRPSTLEKLAALASDTSAPKSSARSAPEL